MVARPHRRDGRTRLSVGLLLFVLKAGDALAPATTPVPNAGDRRMPVTVLTGFLGSGKTTLINHILTAQHGKKLAIIENEFGAVGIDDALLAKNAKLQAEGEEIIIMMNGCICCTVRQDLVLVLNRLQDRISSKKLNIDGVIIETTGLADPAPVAQTFFLEESVKEHFRLDGIVTMVDAKHVEQHLDEEKPEGAENEAVEQVAFADRILLNKIDLVSPSDLARVEKRLREINAFAPIEQCMQSSVDVGSVLDLGAFDLQRTLEMDEGFLDTDAHHAHHEHDATVTSVAISEPGEVDLVAIDEWISTTLRDRGGDIFRMKGILALQGAPQKFVYQGVHMVFNGAYGDEWAEGEARTNKLVFIGKHLDADALRAEFSACLYTPEMEAKKLAALRFQIGDEVQCILVGPDYASEPTWRKGKVVARMHREEGLAGVAPYRVQLDDGRFIVAPLDTDMVIKVPLRFEIGTPVECNLGDGWYKGVVVAHMYREAGWAPEEVAPYQVKLEDGSLIFAPHDEDEVIRSLELS